MKKLGPRWCWIGLLLVLTGLGLAFFLTPLPTDLTHPEIGPITLLDQRGREIAQLPSLQARAQQFIPMLAMGEWLPRVTVALEDHRFYEHHGLDIWTIGGSLRRNLRERRIVSGGSTITQQVIKLASGRTARTLSAKVYEIVAAARLERTWNKNRILEEYLNRLHYGNRLVGVQSAARAYFNKNPADLTPPEAIYLAGLPQAPSRFNPWLRPENAEKRYQRSLQRLVTLGLVTADQAQRWSQSPPTVSQNFPSRQAPHFVDAVMLANPQLRGSVPTTLDLDLQHLAQSLVQAQAQTLQAYEAHDAALVVIENATGAVRALVGSTDYHGPRGQLNGALLYRSAGSALKPFVYLHALDTKTITAATLWPDTEDAIRDVYADYDPENYSRRYLGPVQTREALACSLNVPAVLLVHQLGARQAFAELSRWGIQTQRPYDAYGAGFILGHAEVRLLNLTNAYAGLARGGLVKPFVFLSNAATETHRVASTEATAILQDILCDPLARQRSFGLNSPLQTGARFPVKTGTSSGFRDAWCVGFTREHTVGVWVGNFDGRPMREIAAVRSAAPIWRAMIEHLRATDHEIPPPILSEHLTTASICPLSGLLSTSNRPPLNEYFLADTAPTTDASSFFQVIDGKTQILLPPAYARWCLSPWNYLDAKVQPATSLHILSPAAEAVFSFSTQLPPQQQMLELTSNFDGRIPVTWQVDGKDVAAQNGRYFWRLEPGSHQLSVRAGGQQATLTFHVR